MSTRLVRIVIDSAVEPGTYVFGGVRLVEDGDDELLGRELRTKEVRVHGETEAQFIRDEVAKSDAVELTT